MNIKELEKRCNELFFQVNEKTERIADLEKENAELKSNRDYWKGSSIYCHKQLKNKKYRKIAKATQQQLTKAKEIIKDLLNLPFASNEEVFADVGSHLYKAEQFLKEVENV